MAISLTELKNVLFRDRLSGQGFVLTALGLPGSPDDTRPVEIGVRAEWEKGVAEPEVWLDLEIGIPEDECLPCAVLSIAEAEALVQNLNAAISEAKGMMR